MSGRSYAYVPTRRRARAIVDVRSEPALELCARWGAASLRHGLPGRRRFGGALAWAARRDAPAGVAGLALRALPRGNAPEVDAVLERLEAAWPELAARSSRLPADPPSLRALALRRRSSLTVFVFGDGRAPLVVAKAPGDAARLQREADALAEAAPAAIAPAYLGRVGELHVQEALEGEPLPIDPLTPADAAAAAASAAHLGLAAALTRLAEATAKPEPPDELEAPVKAALASGLVGAVERVARGAWSDVAPVSASVLRHRDTSPQNCLVRDGHLVGVVDWENAVTLGAPGFDLWNALLAILEHGAGLRRWSDAHVIEVVRRGWFESPLGQELRAAARRAAVAAGVPEGMLDQLELVFLLRRLGRRLESPAAWAVSAEATAALVAAACAR